MPVASLTNPVVGRHVPRRIRFLHWHGTPARWLKVYGITRPGGVLASGTVMQALQVATAWHAAHWGTGNAADSSLSDHGLGFVIVHEGTDGVYLLLDAWADDNLLRHHVWRAPHHAPTAFASLAGSDIMACVWELAVIEHERQAWLKWMFGARSDARPTAYLADVLNVDG